MIKRILLVAGAAFALSAYSAISDYDKKGCTLGRWTYDLAAVRATAKANGSVILACFMKNDGSCGVCNSVSQSLLETADFKNWAKERKIPLLIADYASNSEGSRAVDCDQYLSFPVFVILDGNDGETRLAWFYVTNVQSGNGTAAVNPKPSKGYQITSIKNEFYSIFYKLLSLQNNAAHNDRLTGKNRHRNAAAIEISPDGKDVSPAALKVHTNWEQGAPNSLGSQHWMNGKTVWAFYEDQFDWWKFQNNAPGAFYEIKAPHLEDPLDIGRVCVFTNRTQAVAAKTYASAMSTAYWTAKMSDLRNGAVFDAPSAGEYYVLFTRRDVTDYTEELALEYTFTLQECNKTAYSFPKLQYDTAEDVGTLAIPVSRSSDAGAGKVSVAIAPAGEDGYDEAVEGEDYAIAAKTIEFANGETVKNLQIEIKRGEIGYEKRSRAFKLVIQSDNEPETGYRETTVFIVDADKEEILGPGLDATKAKTEKFANLNGDNILDTYWLTNRQETAGSVYAFAVDPVEGGFRDFADGRIKVRVSRGGNCISPAAGAKEDASGFAWVCNTNYVFYMFGSDAPEGGDVKIEVAREMGAAGEYPNVKYKITWRRFDRPKVSFENGADASYGSDDLPADCRLGIVADSMADLKAYHAQFRLDVKWNTAAPGTGIAAEPGKDYEAVSAGVCTNESGEASISVKLPGQDRLLYPPRSFDVKLADPGENALYVLSGTGKTSAKVSFEPDDVAPAAAVSLDASKTGGKNCSWADTGVRKLNYTNSVDWIAATKIEPAACYRLLAKDVLVKPAGTALTVDVCTNRAAGAKALFSFNLGDLAVEDPAASPVVSFDALAADKTVWLRVSRAPGETVRAEYNLSLRRWDMPTIRFEKTVAENDDTADGFDVALVREGNTSDEITVRAAAENLSPAAGGDWFGIETNVTFAAGSATASMHVTVKDPDWNAAHWTGDRRFAVTLSEIHPVGALGFDPSGSRAEVVFRETEGTGLDVSDGHDETRLDVTENDEFMTDGPGGVKITNKLAFAVSPDGSVASLARTLNGAEGLAVNDTNDWFRFTGIVAGETYVIKWKMDATDAVVGAMLYVGGAAKGTDISAQAEDGFRYLAKSADDILVCVSRPSRADVCASVNYELSVSKYLWPEISFTAAEATVANADGVVVIGLVRGVEGTNCAARARVDAVAFSGGETWESHVFGRVVPADVEFAEGVTNAEVAVAVQPPSGDGLWSGDWKFKVVMAVDETRFRYGATTNVVVTVSDAAVQSDPADPADDAKAGATEFAAGAGAAASVTNRLNGIDLPHYGKTGYSDTNDWFRIPAKAGHTYRISLDYIASQAAEDLDLQVQVEAAFFAATNLSFTAMEEGLDVPAATAGDIYVRVARSVSDVEAPVSVIYTLSAEEKPWPLFAVSAPAEVSNADGVATVAVTRSANLEGEDTIALTVTDGSATGVVQAGTFCTNLVFAAGETSKTVDVALVAPAAGFWKAGGPFEAALSPVAASPHVSIDAGAGTASVLVKDASGVPENDYPADDAKEGAQEYAFSKDLLSATNHCAAGQNVCWLNGSDTNDWYRFTGTEEKKKYRFEVDGVESSSADGLEPTIAVFDSAMNLLDSARLSDFTKWDFEAKDANGFYVCVSRAADAARDVSVKYVLRFREIASVYARFAAASATVSEAAGEVYLDVVCMTADGETLEQDAVCSVAAAEDPDAAHPATAGDDFDPAPVHVVWAAGTTGGVQRVAIPLSNYDSAWEGDETFVVAMTAESDIEIGDPAEVKVTITDKDPPAYGSVGMKGAGTATVREGGVLPVEFVRAGGDAGAVAGKFSWTVGNVKTDVVVELFADREAGTKIVELPVPANKTFAVSQKATLAFALAATKNSATLAKGSQTKLSLTVLAADYGGQAVSYSAEDASRPAFRAAGSAWYAGADGDSLVAVPPAAGGTSVMSVALTCPCTLSFDATLKNAAGCNLAVKIGGETLKTLTASAKGVAVDIAAKGTKTVQFIFTRGKTGTSPDASATVSNVAVARSAEAAKTGSYAGAATVGGVPGFATMTVSASGAFSLKIACADRTWTASGRDPWTGGQFQAKASGAAAKPLSFAIDAEAGTVAVSLAGEPAAVLKRNVWADKPLSAEAAAAIKAFAGYYTVVLPPEAAGAYGSGYLGVTVAGNGTVRASGVFADGQTATISGTLTPDGAGVALFAKPAAYAGGWFSADLSFSSAGGSAPSVGGSASWKRYEKNGDERFGRAPSAAGGWYDRMENLFLSYEDGLSAKFEDRTAGLSFSANGGSLSVDGYDGMFTVSFARSTGIFSGYVRENETSGGKTVRKSYRYKGMVTPNAAEGAAAGRGFFLRGAESVDVEVEGR